MSMAANPLTLRQARAHRAFSVSTTARYAKPLRQRVTPWAESQPAVALGDVLSMAAELNRNTAARHGVRLHCYALDQPLRVADTSALLKKLDGLLTRTLHNANWGSLVIAQANVTNGYAEFQVCYARPSACTVSTSGIDWIDELWSWQLDPSGA